MIKYVLLTSPASTIKCAHELGRLVAGRHLVVNLIPYNKSRAPPVEHAEAFCLIVSSYGAMCTVRMILVYHISNFILIINLSDFF